MDIPSDGRHVEKDELREIFFADGIFFCRWFSWEVTSRMGSRSGSRKWSGNSIHKIGFRHQNLMINEEYEI